MKTWYYVKNKRLGKNDKKCLNLIIDWIMYLQGVGCYKKVSSTTYKSISSRYLTHPTFIHHIHENDNF